MQQDNNHIENRLRQLENQQLPDLSAMDAHWQQMHHIMQPQIAKLKPLNGKAWLWVAVAACLLGLIILMPKNIDKENKLINENIKPNTEITTEKVDSLSILPSTATTNLLNTTTKKIVGHLSSLAQQAAYRQEIKNDTVAPIVIGKDWAKNISSLSPAETKMILNNLISSIQKGSNFFTISNLKDTVILANEGTAIFVPAHSFDTKDSIVFEIKEFYKYSDIIANGLTTMSDDKQLVSGGMIYLSAKVKGKDVTMNPQKEIRVFIPNLTVKDSMQIFDGVQYGKNVGGDTLATDFAWQNKVNWQLSKVRVDSPILKMFIRAIDLKDDLIRYTEYNGKTKAVFFRSTKSVYSKDELKVILQKKYGDYYDKIRVRKLWERNLLFKKVDATEMEYYEVAYNSYGVGDTAELLPSTVKFNKLDPIDTVYKVVNWKFMGYRDNKQFSPSGAMLKIVGEKYSIAINKLGWLNCDRFYGDNTPKLEVAVDLKDSASNYVTYLIFDKFKSMMQGVHTGNYVRFPNVPVGSAVKIISIGVKEGKIVAAIKSVGTFDQTINNLQFEPVSSIELKSSLNKLDL